MSLSFADIKTRLDQLQKAYAKDLAGTFKISGTTEIELIKPLPLANLEGFLTKLFGSDHALPDIPTGGAIIETLHIKAGDVFTARLQMAFESADWQVMDGLTLSVTSLGFLNKAGAWSGSITAQATVQAHKFDVTLQWPEMILDGALQNDPGVAVARDAALQADTPARRQAAEQAAQAALDQTFDAVDAGGLIAGHGLTPHKAARLDRLALFAAARIQYLQLDIAGSNLIQFHQLTLKTADLSLVYAGGPKARFTGSLETEVDIGRTSFHLKGAKTETGWQIEARGQSTGTLAKIVQDVSAKVLGTGHKITDFGVPGNFANQTVSGDVLLKLDTAKASISLELAVELNSGSARFEIDLTKDGASAKAQLRLGDLTFEVDFAKIKTQSVLAAQFRSENGVSMKLDSLAKLAELDSASTAPPVDASLQITLRDALLAAVTSAGKTRFLIAADLDGGIDLSGLGDLPLVGDLMPRDMGFGLSLAPILPSAPWSAANIEALNTLRGKDGPHLPKTLKRASLGISLKTPGHPPEPLDLPLTSDPAKPGDLAKPAAPKNGDEALHWKDLQRSFGPVTVNRVGIGLDRKNAADPTLRIALDGGLVIAGLDLSLIGLEGHYGLTSKTLGFDLRGLGLEFERGPIKIAGAFANLGGDYLGKATLGTKSFTLSALGGFAMIADTGGKKTPSMFLYGMLNVPLGGPAFFFVEGLAAGFGYNRKFTAPDVSGVRSFPFVVDAVGASGGNKRKAGKIGDELERLHDFITPQLGEYFGAIGVKFTSFKLLDSFALLVVSFGREVEIDVLGVSTYQMPPIVPKGTPALARIELDLVASFRPKTGELKIRAELGKNSFVYASLCHLSGGFAFYSWFGPENAGDFVLTAGGYHPQYPAPDYYPKVPRIALTYQITPDIYVKGSAYMALTPSMFMAGGSLSASASFGKVSASFTMGVDFLISWEPYHYDAKAYLDIRASWWIFHTHAHAELAVWGPSFAGHAKVHWSVISFSVSFGHSLPVALPITWDHFLKSFLPYDAASKTTKVAPGLAIAGGQIGEQSIAGAEPIPVINPKTPSIRIDTVLPALTRNSGAISGTDTLGCAPLNVAALKSADIRISIQAKTLGNALDRFHAKDLIKGFPSAMWGYSSTRALHDKTQLNGCGGVLLTPATKPVPTNAPTPPSISREDCAYDIHPDTGFAGHFQPSVPPAVRQTQTGVPVATALNPAVGSVAANNRQGILSDLGLPPETAGTNETTARNFRVAPTIAGIS
ncbi:DUF6603 domain-containing protein [Primorskyibacter sp. 2E233]|uniref:DUF6603 domain-containing protein n=1 Tax=Primorskyibacter sp. 2E233 TaxID=3413431 RepID=UPI003BF349DE